LTTKIRGLEINPIKSNQRYYPVVIPAKAGIQPSTAQVAEIWTPTFVGVTI
jgi:hypothetical protein